MLIPRVRISLILSTRVILIAAHPFHLYGLLSPPPPHIMGGGEENHNLCCVFLRIQPNLHFITSFITASSKEWFRHFSHRGTVDRASAWQTQGRRFEPVLMRYIFGGKHPSA